MPRPGLLDAPGIKPYRHRRRVGGQHRMVFGTLGAIAQVFAAGGWQSKTAFGERLTLPLRQRVAAGGRRGNTRGQGEDGWQHQLAVFHVYHNFVRPHASWRQPLLAPEMTNGRGSAQGWRPWTPAMAAGLTDPGWTLQDVLLDRVPPWPQPSRG